MAPFLDGKTIVRIYLKGGKVSHKWKKVNDNTIRRSVGGELLSTKRRNVGDLDLDL